MELLLLLLLLLFLIVPFLVFRSVVRRMFGRRREIEDAQRRAGGQDGVEAIDGSGGPSFGLFRSPANAGRKAKRRRSTLATASNESELPRERAARARGKTRPAASSVAASPAALRVWGAAANFNVEQPEDLATFEDVGGMEELKREVRDTVGLMLQTYFARAIAGEYGLNLIHVSTGDLVSSLSAGRSRTSRRRSIRRYRICPASSSSTSSTRSRSGGRGRPTRSRGGPSTSF